MRKYLLAVILVLPSCKQPSAVQGGAAKSGSAEIARKAAEPGGIQLRLSLHKVMDTQGTGKLSGTYLLPEGYTATDEVKWMPNAYITPVVETSKLTSGDGQIVMESMSGVQTNFGHAPAGSFGVDPPRSVSAYVLSLWKRAHPGPSFQVASKVDTDIPDASHSGPGYRMYGKRGTVELRFIRGGVTYRVKTSARIDVMSTIPETTAIGGTMYEGGWVISGLNTVMAPEEKMPEAMKLFGIALASYKMDPHFFNTVMQAREIIQRNFYQRLGQIMETSRIISQTNDEMSAAINSQYKTGQSVAEHEAASFDDYIRGIDHYDESDGQVSLPSGYAKAWSDGNGSYIVTDEHLYDPNVNGPGGTWHEMEHSK